MMKKVIFGTVAILFVAGLLSSNFFTDYFIKPGEFIEDVLVLKGKRNARRGTMTVCNFYGNLIHTKEENSVSCEFLKKNYPTLDLRLLSELVSENDGTYELNVYTHTTQGGIHVFRENEKSYYPGAKKVLPFLSLETFLLLPLPVLIMYLWGRKNKYF